MHPTFPQNVLTLSRKVEECKPLLLGWSASPEQACERLLWLNDHFALDGQSPPSVGGLMGCLGLFESPKVGLHIFYFIF
jgi:hypothetical protein